MRIRSAANPHVKSVVKLRHSRHRKRQNRFIVEGLRSVRRAAAAGIRFCEVYVCEDLLTDPAAVQVAADLRQAGAARYELPTELFGRIAYRKHPEGLLAVAERPTHALADLPVTSCGLFVVAESLEKPGNLGAILRSVDAAGADGLILCDEHTDIYNPNVIRASTATVFSVPIAEASANAAIAWLREHRIALAATVCEGGEDYAALDWTGPVAIVLGSEHAGISPQMQDAADLQVTIPMAGEADSLNVAATATVLLFEAARQRRCGTDR